MSSSWKSSPGGASDWPSPTLALAKGLVLLGEDLEREHGVLGHGDAAPGLVLEAEHVGVRAKVGPLGRGELVPQRGGLRDERQEPGEIALVLRPGSSDRPMRRVP